MVKRQHGSALLLAVGCALVGLLALVYLAWIPLVERSSRNEINLIASRICDSVTRKAPLTGIMWGEFQESIRNATYPTNPEIKGPRYAQVLEAHLYVAGPGESFDTFPLAPAPGIDWRASESFKDYHVYGHPNTTIEGDSIVNPNNSNESVRVFFHNSFRDAPISPFIVNDIRNFGNTAVCVFTGRAKTALFGISKDLLTRSNAQSTFSVISGSWNPVQGVNSIPPLQPPSGETLSPSSAPGVVIEIAPQLPELDLAGVTPGIANFSQISEPLLSNDSRFKPSSDVLSKLNMVTSRGFTEESPEGQITDSNGISHYAPPTTLDSNPLDISSPLVQERIIGCVNPLAVLRQAFTSTLAELMSRHGQLRNNTEILLVNGRKFEINTPSNFSHESWAPPALIVRGGNDLATNNYQLPFVAMKDFITSTSWSASLDDEVATNERNWRSLLAGQLSHCAHLYANSDGVSFSSPIASDTLSSLQPEGLYSPQEFHILPNAPLLWQRDSLKTDIPLMSAFQILSQIGSTRSCPIVVNSSRVPSTCRSSGAINNLLLPDISALSHFTSPIDQGEVTSGTNFALNSPGALLTDSSILSGDFSHQNVLTPASETDYNYPMQILVMHTITPEIIQMLTEWKSSGRLNQLFYRSDRNVWGNVRPFRLVLFPAASMSAQQMNDLANALQTTTSGQQAGLNRIFVIEPCEIDDKGEKLYPTFCANPATAYTSSNLRNFWNSLVFDTTLKNNIFERAREFFLFHVVTTARIL